MAFHFYLDVQIPNEDEEFYLWVDTWKDFYDNVSYFFAFRYNICTNNNLLQEFLPSTLNLTAAQRSLVLGGEAR